MMILRSLVMELAVLIGSYERFVFKLVCNLQNDVTLTRSATHAAHLGPVKCIDCLSSTAFSGGQDDSIQIFDIRSGTNNGFIQVPEVTSISSLALFALLGGMEPTFLINGCFDGSLHFWKKLKGEWELQKTKNFHKASVVSLDVHSSGKVAFSLANDRSLVLWDIAKLKRAFSCKLAVEGQKIMFHPYSPDKYCISHQNTVSKLSLANDQSIENWTQMADVQEFCFWKEQSFVTVSDDGALRLWDERTSAAELEVLDAHSARIKGLSTPHLNHFITASSDGVVKVWDSRNLENGCLSQEETEARITCLTSTTCNPKTKQKSKHVR